MVLLGVGGNLRTWVLTEEVIECALKGDRDTEALVAMSYPAYSFLAAMRSAGPGVLPFPVSI